MKVKDIAINVNVENIFCIETLYTKRLRLIEYLSNINKTLVSIAPGAVRIFAVVELHLFFTYLLRLKITNVLITQLTDLLILV